MNETTTSKGARALLRQGKALLSRLRGSTALQVLCWCTLPLFPLFCQFVMEYMNFSGHLSYVLRYAENFPGAVAFGALAVLVVFGVTLLICRRAARGFVAAAPPLETFGSLSQPVRALCSPAGDKAPLYSAASESERCILSLCKLICAVSGVQSPVYRAVEKSVETLTTLCSTRDRALWKTLWKMCITFCKSTSGKKLCLPSCFQKPERNI